MSESKFPTLWVCMSSDLYPIYAVRHPRENLVEYVPASELARAEADRDEARSRISAALDMAGGRWSEWGDRAVSVANILEGIQGDDDAR